jgi:hypothetical protein
VRQVRTKQTRPPSDEVESQGSSEEDSEGKWEEGESEGSLEEEEGFGSSEEKAQVDSALVPEGK